MEKSNEYNKIHKCKQEMCREENVTKKGFDQETIKMDNCPNYVFRHEFSAQNNKESAAKSKGSCMI